MVAARGRISRFLFFQDFGSHLAGSGRLARASAPLLMQVGDAALSGGVVEKVGFGSGT